MESHIEIGIWRFLSLLPLPNRLESTNFQSFYGLIDKKAARSFLDKTIDVQMWYYEAP